MTNIIKTEHIPALDGLRGLAALMVFVSHCNERGLISESWTSFLGAMGVTLFFTLSGFLMAYLYASKEWCFEKVWRYGVSRFSRIAPAYLFVILASYTISQWIGSGFVYYLTNENLLRHLLFSGNVSSLWSIPPEVQFYVFFLALWWAVTCTRKKSFLPLGIMVGCIIIMQIFAKQAPGTTLPSKLPFFLLGSLAGLIRANTQISTIKNNYVSLFQTASLIGLLGYAGFLTYTVLTNGTNYTYSHEAFYFSLPYAIFCGLVILSLSYHTRLAKILFANKPLRVLGAWSFAFYLLHEPILQLAAYGMKTYELPSFLMINLGLIISIATAALLHYMVEKPAQASIKKFSTHCYKKLPRLLSLAKN